MIIRQPMNRDIHTDGKVFTVSREREVCRRGLFCQRRKSLVKDWNGEVEIIDTKDIFLPGKHNLENVCAASDGGNAWPEFQ